MSPNFLCGHRARSQIPAVKTNAGDISVSQSAWACPLAEKVRILNGEAPLGHADNWANVSRAAARRLAMRRQERIARRNGRQQLLNRDKAYVAWRYRSNLQAAYRSIAPVAWVVEETKAADVALPDDVVAVEAEHLGIEGVKENQLVARTDDKPKHRGHTGRAVNLHQVPTQFLQVTLECGGHE